MWTVRDLAAPHTRAHNDCAQGRVRLALSEKWLTGHHWCVLPACLPRRPGVYREYMRDLCDRVSTSQSHNMHKLVGFEPFAPAALAFRIAVTAAALRQEGGGLAALSLLQAARVAATVVALWAALLLVKLGLGYLLKPVATAYLQHFETARRGSRLALPHRRVTLGAAAMAQAAAAAGAKKEE